MSNDYFKCQRFTVKQDMTAMKVGIDSILLGSWIRVSGSEKNVLDIGTGTGLLALMMAQKIPGATIVACEIDETACRQASENISSSEWSDRITVVNADVRMLNNPESFDLIICNPPYFEKSLKPADSKRNIARHSDSLPFPDLIDCVHRLMHGDGRFALTVPTDKAGTVIELAAGRKLFPLKRLNVKHTETKPANRVILEFGRVSQPVEEYLLTVRTGNRYSDEYKSVTGDFYLL
jgi:tRNA1Val (adenine37-N6)-methyltransferase